MHHCMQFGDSWRYYKKLVRAQEEVLLSRSDENAFIYALNRFPRLKRATITPSAHGVPFKSLYQTPMIRALPYGLRYVIPRSWPTTVDRVWGPVVQWDVTHEDYKDNWRGVSIALRALAEHDHNVTELSLHANDLSTGIYWTIFEQSCEDCDNFLAIMKKPGFRHLDMSLIVEEKPRKLYQALSEAKEMRHIDIRTAFDRRVRRKKPIPIRNIFPVNQWPNLRHFGLYSFYMDESDLIALLSALPQTVQSIDLGLLGFNKKNDSIVSVLYDMRDELGWQQREVEVRPNVVISVISDDSKSGTVVWTKDSVNSFIYGRRKKSL